MKISNYSYYCSNLILQMISNISKDKTIMEISNNYSEMFDLNNEVDIKWMLISTSLLMSEGLFKNNKAYDYISEKTIDEIKEKFFTYERWLPGEKVNTPYLLDRTNKSAMPFRDFLSYPKFNVENYDYIVDLDEFDEEYVKGLKQDYYYNEYEDPNLIDGAYGCNDSIISDGLINIRNLIIRVRNAMAHSNYEIINEDNIRLYHYNRKEKKLDFNVILDTSTIINILDELNEIAYKKYNDFNTLYFSDKYYDEDLIVKDTASRDDFIEYIMNFELCDREIAKRIYDKAINSELYKTLTYDDREFSDNKKKYYDNYNKMAVIAETMYDYIKPYCDFGIIINNMMYASDDGKIDSDELYVKYDIYNYLKSDFYESNYSDKDDSIYRDNQLNLLILSFLNCSLLTSHNEYENNNIDYLKLDFSTMEIEESIINLFISKHIDSNNKLLISLNEDVVKIDKEINDKSNYIVKKREILSTKYVDNEYFNIKLPDEINRLEIEIDLLNRRKEEILNRIKEISLDGLKYNYDEDLSNFIFKSLRNSLAHGYVKISKINNSIADTEIIFEDYNPSNKTELTFKGKIKFGDLLRILTKEDNIDKLYNIDSSVSKIRKK